MNILSNLNIILIFISISSIYSKESSMITVPLKVIHNGFEKYPLPNVTKITIEKPLAFRYCGCLRRQYTIGGKHQWPRPLVY